MEPGTEIVLKWTKEKFGAYRWPHFVRYNFFYKQEHHKVSCDICWRKIALDEPVIIAHEPKTSYINNTFSFCKECGEKVAKIHKIEVRPY